MKNQEDMVIAREVLEDIFGRVENLPTNYQHVIFLRTKGYSIKETSKILKISSAAVKSRMHRGRNILRKDFERLFPELINEASALN